MPAGKLELPPAASMSEVLAALYEKHRAVLPSDASALQLAFQVGRHHASSLGNHAFRRVEFTHVWNPNPTITLLVVGTVDLSRTIFRVASTATSRTWSISIC